MFWVIQEDVHAKNQNYNIIEALTRLGVDFMTVQVQHNTITPEAPENITQPIITNGSIMLSNIAKAKGWEPGSFFNDNFSYTVWQEYYHEFLINKNAVVSTLKDAKIEDDKVFARPILDNKTFNGRVFTKEEFLLFQQESLQGKQSRPRSETEILLSKPKSIGQEHRHYIVDGEVITSSRYKFAGMANFKQGCDNEVLEVVQKAIDIWQPARAFVLDTYISGDEIGIVEIGSICHAGMYDADLMKLVITLDSMDMTLKNEKANKLKR